MSIRQYQNTTPTLGNEVYVDETAVVIGDVVLGDDSSVWPHTTIRGDVNHIRIGQGSNIQDGSVLHVTHENPEAGFEGHPLTVGNHVTVGHRVILHGCSIEDYCLIGMGSVVSDGVKIQPYVLLGAGSLVPPGKQLQSGYLYMGSPARQVRALTQAEKQRLRYSAEHYVRLKNHYLSAL